MNLDDSFLEGDILVDPIVTVVNTGDPEEDNIEELITPDG